MLKHEQKVFWKFFSIYFGSVAFLIVIAGYFYFGEQKKTIIEKEHFSMIEYIRKIKMQEKHTIDKGITYIVVDKKIKKFHINNFIITEKYFAAYVPYSWDGGYYFVKKDARSYKEKVFKITIYILLAQLILLILFASISYFLALRALKPMQEAIEKLDNFSKDLIHDLNTPVTSILLNMKILEANEDFKNNRALQRIKHSTKDISELHENLSLLLQEDTLQLRYEDVFEIVYEIVSTHKKIHPNIQFIVENSYFEAKININAFKQVLTNIISNACKYNKQNGRVKIYAKDESLFIEDSGVGIKEPQKIFERLYKEQRHGYGIGLDIAQRLCSAMNINISVHSKLGVGTQFVLKMNNKKVKK